METPFTKVEFNGRNRDEIRQQIVNMGLNTVPQSYGAKPFPVAWEPDRIPKSIRDQKIPIIKLVRQDFNLPLKEAKDLTEWFMMAVDWEIYK